MERALDYLVYCIELYSSAKGMSPSEVAKLFRQTGADEYVTDCFDALHLTGPEYMVEDVDRFIRAKDGDER